MSVNKVILVGNVGKDPEVRYLDNDVAVANFTLATTERGYKSRDGQTTPDRTEWHNIVAWRGLAKIAENYIHKGSQIYVEGKIRNRTYDDKDGNKRYITEIFADSIQLLGRKPDNAPSAQGNNMNQSAQQPQNSTHTGKETGSDSLHENNQEDDLPF